MQLPAEVGIVGCAAHPPVVAKVTAVPLPAASAAKVKGPPPIGFGWHTQKWSLQPLTGAAVEAKVVVVLFPLRVST
jgi:hypothetical protein